MLLALLVRVDQPAHLQVQFGWTLSNYSGIFQKLYLEPIVRSLVLSVGATLACLLIGFPVAYTIARASGRRQALLLLAVMIPFWTSFVVRTYGIYNVISYNGPMYRLLHSLGMIHGYIHVLFTPIGVGIGIVYTYLPLMILPLYVVAGADRSRAARGRQRSRRDAAPRAAAGDPAAGRAGDHRRHASWWRSPHRRVRDPADPRRRQDADVRQRRLRPVPDIGNYPFGAALAVALTVRADDRADVPALAQLQGGGGADMRSPSPRPRSVITAIVMVCLYAPIVAVLIYSVDKDPLLISWKGFTTSGTAGIQRPSGAGMTC